MAIVAVNGLCYAQHTLTMKLNDVTNDTAVVMTFNKTLRGVERQDSILAQRGVFTYDYRGTQARTAMVYFKKNNALKRMTVYLVPGEEALLTGTSEQPVWNGSAFYTELALGRMSSHLPSSIGMPRLHLPSSIGHLPSECLGSIAPSRQPTMNHEP